MALSRVTVWAAGNTLTAAALNGEVNNVLNNPISLISPTTGAIDFDLRGHSRLIPSAISATSGGGLPIGTSMVRGLIGTVTSSQTATLSADQYCLQTTASYPTFFSLNSTASFTLNIGSTSSPAANGRDVAANFSSTFVHVYAITTGGGSTTPAGIASTTPPPSGPVMPTNYSAWTYLGTYPYSSASTTFTAGQRVRGASVHYEALQTVLTNGNNTTETAVSLAALMPAIALNYQVRTQVVIGNATVANRCRIRIVSGSDYITNVAAGSGIDAFLFGLLWLPNVSQQFFYLLSSAAASAADALQAELLTYTVPNGDA